MSYHVDVIPNRNSPLYLVRRLLRKGSWFDGPDLKQRPGRGCNILRGQFPFS